MPINDFTIIKQLGSGAFSTVSLVTRKQDKKIYALKCVQISKLSPVERQNSLNEIRLLASINHKNIISYKESFYNEENHTLNMILEYADDGDLQTKIISKKKFGCFFEEKTIWSIFIQMVKGLNELHKKKIIHRDLKSANIFLMKNGVCKLGDLNVAKVVENGLLRTQTGTPYFASPEIWEDKPYSFKSDIWSIGCILYQIAGLKMPFQGKNIKEVYYNLKNINIPPLPDIYSPDLMNMVKKLLKLNPDERPSTQEILEDEIIKKWMKIINENDKDLIDISLDINNFKKYKNKSKLINSIKVNDDKNLNFILPQKNYQQKELEKLYFHNKNNINEKTELTEENINSFNNNISNNNDKINNNKEKKIHKQHPKKNFSFNQENLIPKKNLKKSIN
jgi:NIMA (never in mitosis gene a)-related kinase